MAKKEPSQIIYPTNINEAKIWLRQFLIKSRQSLNRYNQITQSRQICRKVIGMPEFKRAKTIAVYLGFGNEVLTDKIVQAAWKEKKNVLIPVTALGFHKPYFVLFGPGDLLKKTPFGPLEPTQIKVAFDFRLIDLVIVPGVGFDKQGHRLGYGGSVYDRLLYQTHHAIHLGLAFSCQILPHLPVDKHDQRLTKIVAGT